MWYSLNMTVTKIHRNCHLCAEPRVCQPFKDRHFCAKCHAEIMQYVQHLQHVIMSYLRIAQQRKRIMENLGASSAA